MVDAHLVILHYDAMYQTANWLYAGARAVANDLDNSAWLSYGAESSYYEGSTWFGGAWAGRCKAKQPSRPCLLVTTAALVEMITGPLGAEIDADESAWDSSISIIDPQYRSSIGTTIEQVTAAKRSVTSAAVAPNVLAARLYEARH